MSIGRAHLLALATGGRLCLGASSAGAGASAIGCGSTLTKSIVGVGGVEGEPGSAGISIVDTGIVVAEDTPGHTSGNSLKHNTASRNRGRGIDAAAGSIDGGGIARAAMPRRRSAGT